MFTSYIAKSSLSDDILNRSREQARSLIADTHGVKIDCVDHCIISSLIGDLFQEINETLHYYNIPCKNKTFLALSSAFDIYLTDTISSILKDKFHFHQSKRISMQFCSAAMENYHAYELTSDIFFDKILPHTSLRVQHVGKSLSRLIVGKKDINIQGVLWMNSNSLPH